MTILFWIWSIAVFGAGYITAAIRASKVLQGHTDHAKSILEGLEEKREARGKVPGEWLNPRDED